MTFPPQDSHHDVDQVCFSFCRIGFSSRCVHDILFGCASLNGAQAQYVRVPKAGGTLFVVSSSPSTPSYMSLPQTSIASFSDSSLLLLADILPTGYFTALQALQHPNVLPLLSGTPYPLSAFANVPNAGKLVNVLKQVNQPSPTEEDRVLTIAVIGLGPVGIVSTSVVPRVAVPKPIEVNCNEVRRRQSARPARDTRDQVPCSRHRPQ